jgi:hypothetical protein
MRWVEFAGVGDGAGGPFGHGMPCPYEKKLQFLKSRRDAGGTNGECEKNDVAREPSIGDLRCATAWGTGVIFTGRLLADACATERRRALFVMCYAGEDLCGVAGVGAAVP